ncbi:MAG: ATP-binding cassette domain-containing protein [Alphaproteobacteria bacterium]|nr:ATP-binding cassette domain-containing protein [Alphaproteobacteria bacterium]
MTAALALDNASVSIEGRDLIRRLTIDLRPGELLGLVGPNGAGKSTAIRAVLGLVELSDGAARMGADETTNLTPLERARCASYLPQVRTVAWGLPVEDVVALGRFAFGAGRRETIDAEAKSAIDRAIAAADIEALRGRSVQTLSGGEAARVHFARALCAETPILVADEPTAALDPRHAHLVMQTLRARADAGGAVLVAIHDLTLAAQYCSRVAVLSQGSLAAEGPPASVLTPERLAAIFGVRAAANTIEGHAQLAILGLTPSP